MEKLTLDSHLLAHPHATYVQHREIYQCYVENNHFPVIEKGLKVVDS